MYGSTIVKFRKEKLKLKQFELAEKMGVNVATLNTVENDYRRPSLKFLERIAKAGNVHISELLSYNLKPTK